MRKLLVIAAVLCFLAAFGFAQDVVPILEVDNALQGIWHLTGYSTDGGLTKKYGNDEALLRCYGTFMQTLNGKQFAFIDLIQVQDSAGGLSEWVKFSDGAIWMISKELPPYILVIEYQKNKETIRWLFRLGR